MLSGSRWPRGTEAGRKFYNFTWPPMRPRFTDTYHFIPGPTHVLVTWKWDGGRCLEDRSFLGDSCSPQQIAGINMNVLRGASTKTCRPLLILLASLIVLFEAVAIRGSPEPLVSSIPLVNADGAGTTKTTGGRHHE